MSHQQSLFQIHRLYILRGFCVVDFIMDGQIELVQGYVKEDLVWDTNLGYGAQDFTCTPLLVGVF